MILHLNGVLESWFKQIWRLRKINLLPSTSISITKLIRNIP